MQYTSNFNRDIACTYDDCFLWLFGEGEKAIGIYSVLSSGNIWNQGAAANGNGNVISRDAFAVNLNRLVVNKACKAFNKVYAITGKTTVISTVDALRSEEHTSELQS